MVMRAFVSGIRACSSPSTGLIEYTGSNVEYNVRPKQRARSLRLVAAGLLAASVVLIGPARPTYASGGTVSGVVFDDYNANGVKDTREPGVGSVSVTEIDATGATTTAITKADGTYSLNVATFPARIEFTSLPANYASGPHGTGSGTISGTTTQFYSAATSSANLGINVPSNYCDNNPGVSTSCYVYGNQLGTTKQPNNGGTVNNSGEGVIVHFKYLDTGATMPMAIATAKQVGTTFGLAYQQTSDTLYAAAFFKRHAGLGPGGLGAIYKITHANIGTPDAPALLTTVPNVGTDPRTSPLTSYDFFHDSAAFPLVGKIGLGGLKISADGQTLYTVNLNDRKLYSIPIATPNSPTSYSVPTNGTCDSANDIRPFGLGVDNNTGTVYLGEVCTAQTSGLLTDMRGLVYSFNPGSGMFSTNPVLNFSLNYNRNCAFNSGCSQDLTGSTAQKAQSAHFHPWTDTFDPATQFNQQDANKLGAWPQAILSDIAVDNGSLVIALRNRFADQTGYNTGGTLTTDNGPYQGIEAGGLLRANLSAGTLSLDLKDTAQETFYTPVTALGNYHQRAAMGSVLQVPGFSDTMSTLIDPLNTAYTGGTRRFNADSGAAVNSHQIYGNNQVSFGKAAGLGGLTALCTSAPIEIGNRVWSDTNGNGIQDPGEVGIAGVTVQLLSSTGAVIASATTDSNGEYYFSSAAGTSTGSAIYGLSLIPFAKYTLQIAGFAGQAPLTGLVPTTANAADTQANSKGVKSVSGTDVVDLFSTLGAGVDDHTQDFGFTKSGPTGTPTPVGGGGTGTPEAPSGVLFGIGAVAVLAALMRRRANGQRRMGL